MITSMKLLILYYSGTRNTEFACMVAKNVAERSGHEVTMKTFAKAGEISLGEYDAYCFATPLQAWQPTKNVERFIKAMQPMDGKAAFLLSSSGGQPSQTAPLMAGWLKRKGIAVTGHFDLLCPDSWPVSRRQTHRLDQERPDVESLRELADFTRRMLEMQVAFLAGEKVALPRYLFYLVEIGAALQRPPEPDDGEEEGYRAGLHPMRDMREGLSGRCHPPGPVPGLQQGVHRVLAMCQLLPRGLHYHPVEQPLSLQGNTG